MASQDGLDIPQRYWALAATTLAVTMAAMDEAIANIALPTISTSLGSDPASTIWVVNGYQLAITICLLPLASLGDIVGYRRVYLGGLIVFTAASLACALSESLFALTAARVVQGFGAAGIMSVNPALLRFIFPHRMIGRAVGFNALVVATALAAGPAIGGLILSVAPWPYLFAINLPLGVLALSVGLRALPASQRSPHPFDIWSALLSAATFGLLIGGVDEFAHGGSGLLVVAELGASALLGILLVRRQLNMASPLLPIDLLRIPAFAFSIGASVTAFAAVMGAFVALPFLLHADFHFSPAEIGLLVTPWPIAVGVAAQLSGPLADRFPGGAIGSLALLALAGGLVSLTFLPAEPSHWDVMWRMALCGAGFGFFQTPNNRALLLSAPRERSGGAGGMLATARLLGQTMGAAMVALLFARAAMSGPTLALYVAVGLALTAAGINIGRFISRPAAVQRVGSEEVEIARK